MTISPDSLPVLADAIYTIGDEIGFNAAADAEYVARQIDAAGFDIVPRPTVRLSPRQHQTLLFLAAGLSTREIAGRLCVTPGGVYSRVAALKKALGVSSRFDVLLVADRLGLISDADVDAVLNPPQPGPGLPLTPKPHATPADARRIAARMETP